jgi:hypothetical protein
MFAAYLLRKSDNASVWYFNYQLASSLFFAGLATLVLCAGLSLILLSLSYLFELKAGGKVYLDIWIIGACVFAPAYFITNIPRQFDYPQSDCAFPRGIHFIQHYVLTPLSLIYMVILYAYFAKILLQWELPRGNLGMMICIFGVIGIITQLTIFPVSTSGTPLLRWFYRNFYTMMVVPLGLLMLAISVRISQYGMTEPRYIVLICTLWFALLIAYYAIKGTAVQLKTIPMLLALLALLVSFGPWRIDKLPVKNQFARLQEQLVQLGLLVNNQYLPPKTQPDFEQRQAITSMVSYLVSHGASEKIRPWFSDQRGFDKTLNCGTHRCYDHQGRQLVLELMGIDEAVDANGLSHRRNHFFTIVGTGENRKTFRHDNHLVAVDNYDYAISISVHQSVEASKIHNYEVHSMWQPDISREISMSLSKNNTLDILHKKQLTMSIDMNPLLNQYPASGEVIIAQENAHQLILQQSSEGIAAKLLIATLHGKFVAGKHRITSLRGILLIRLGD